jgi:hypothetical protein
MRNTGDNPIYLGGSWTPEEGFQPLEQVSAYPPELTERKQICSECGLTDGNPACPECCDVTTENGEE